ncbi:hypothetical protein ACS0TY_003757 [Phlomoides rotata]
MSGFRQDEMDEIGCDVSKDQAHIAKRLTLKKLERCLDSQFSRLWDYVEEPKRTNPGSIVIVGFVEDDNGDTKFNKLYICLVAVKKGFAACRPLIGRKRSHEETEPIGEDETPTSEETEVGENKNRWIKCEFEVFDDEIPIQQSQNMAKSKVPTPLN